MKKNALFSSAILALLLASCGAPASSAPSSSAPTSSSTPEQKEEILLVNPSSQLIGTPRGNPEAPGQTLPELEENLLIATLPTYRRKGKGVVPYVNLTEYCAAVDVSLSYLLKAGLTSEVQADGFHLYAPGKKGEMVFNAANDTVKIKNSGAFAQSVFIENNGIPGDYINYRGNSIRESDKTKVYKMDGSGTGVEFEAFSFGDYGFDIYQEAGKYYVPLEALTKLMYRDVSLDIAYNGADYYLTAAVDGVFTTSRILSSKGWWKGNGCIWQPVTPGEGEAYRFACSFERQDPSGEGTQACTKFFVLYDNEIKNGKIRAFVGDAFDPSKEIQIDESTQSFYWQKTGDLLRIRMYDNGTVSGDYWVHLNETYFLKNEVPAELSQYNYNILRFLFDNIYGLKEIKQYASADAYFTSLGVKEGLQSTNVSQYNEAVAKLIGAVDDGHSQYKSLSVFTSLDNFLDLASLNKKYQGQRVKALGDKYAAAAKARVDKMRETNPGAPDDPNFYHGMKLSSDKNTIVLTFDSFMHNDPEIKNIKEQYPEGIGSSESTYQDLNYIVRGRYVVSTPEGMSAAFASLDRLNKDGATKNVVIDLTCNGGGQISTLAYIAAFFTADPTYALTDPRTKQVFEYHYKVDLNGDGVYGGAGDTYQGKYNFYFLTSGFSFSCGNALPGMGKDSGAKIIGERSGGGTSPVGIYFDALGSVINLSNYRLMSYKGTDGKYMQNDAGIPLDHEFPLQNGNWYDADAINAFIKTLG